MQITFTSDLGQQNIALSILKSGIYHVLPKVHLIDITHYIESGSYIQAVYYLKSTFDYPSHSVHIVLVDLFSNLDKYLILANYKEQYYIAPNNAILSMLLEEEEAFTFVKAVPIQHHNGVIHMRLILETVVATLKKLYHREPVEHFTQDQFELQAKKMPRFVSIQKQTTDGQIYYSITAYIILIDEFGNLIINMTLKDFQRFFKNKIVIRLKGREEIHKISHHYSDVPRGAMVAFFNINGFLEIAINGSKLSNQGFVNESAIFSPSTKYTTHINDFYKTVEIDFY